MLGAGTRGGRREPALRAWVWLAFDRHQDELRMTSRAQFVEERLPIVVKDLLGDCVLPEWLAGRPAG